MAGTWVNTSLVGTATGAALPVRLMMNGSLVASLLAMCKTAVRLPAAAGVKVTTKVLPSPAAKELAGTVVSAYSAALVPLVVTASPVRAAEPRFLIVMVRGTATPVRAEPKSTVPEPLARAVPAGCSTTMRGTAFPRLVEA